MMTLEGDGHTNFVAAIVPGKGRGGPGSVAAFSVGYDDQLKEISGGGWGFGCVLLRGDFFVFPELLMEFILSSFLSAVLRPRWVLSQRPWLWART